MENYVYGVVDDTQKLLVERVEIKKETDKQIILAECGPATDYRSVLNKSQFAISRTPHEALKAFIKKQEKEMKFLLREVRKIEGDVDAATALLGRVCDECGAVRVDTPSGVVCPNGHGKVFPKPKRS